MATAMTLEKEIPDEIIYRDRENLTDVVKIVTDLIRDSKMGSWLFDDIVEIRKGESKDPGYGSAGEMALCIAKVLTLPPEDLLAPNPQKEFDNMKLHRLAILSVINGGLEHFIKDYGKLRELDQEFIDSQIEKVRELKVHVDKMNERRNRVNKR